MEDMVLAIQTPEDYQEQFDLIYSIVSQKGDKKSQLSNSTGLLEALFNVISEKSNKEYTRYACLLVIY